MTFLFTLVVVCSNTHKYVSLCAPQTMNNTIIQGAIHTFLYALPTKHAIFLLRLLAKVRKNIAYIQKGRENIPKIIERIHFKSDSMYILTNYH